MSDLTRRLKHRVTAMRNWMSSPAGKRLRTGLAVVVVLAALGGVGYQLAYGANAINWREVTLEWSWLLMAMALLVISQLLGGPVWYLVLAGLHYPLSLGTCTRIHINATIAKYVPGYAWQLLGKAYLTQQEGVPASVVPLALALELGSNMLSGIMVAAWLLPSAASIDLGIAPWIAPVIGTAAAVSLTASPWLINIGRKLVGGSTSLHVRPAPIWAAQGIFVMAWLILGTSTYWTILALTPQYQGLWSTATVSLAAAFMVSLIIFFVPAGIGVREGAMTSLLSQAIGGGNAATVAILSRLMQSIVEWGTLGALWAVQSALTLYNRSITHRGSQ